MSRDKKGVSTEDGYLKLIVSEKMRVSKLPSNEDTDEYNMNLNKALSAYSDSEIEKVKNSLCQKQKIR